MSKPPPKLLLRALNQTRMRDNVAYVALRAAAESQKSLAPDWLEQFVNHRTLIRRSWSFRRYFLFKGYSPEGDISYRTMHGPSPLAALTEAYLLFHLAKEPAFAAPQRAYSYLWPKSPRSSRNYQFFLEGYRSRNESVRSQMRENTNLVAVVTDIRAFYPSVNQNDLLSRLHRRLESIGDETLSASVSRYASELLGQTSQGIPIGPDFGHLLGHIALEDVDDTLTRRFGNRYARYVDDIVLLCRPEEVDRSRGLLVELLGSQGMALHEGKEDLVGSRKWVQECPKMGTQGHGDKFGVLINVVAGHVAGDEVRERHLADAFHDKGIPFPVSRVSGMARMSGWRRVINYLLSHRTAQARAVEHGASCTVQEVLEEADAVRRVLWEILTEAVDGVKGQTGLVRRWKVQLIRYASNRLLYVESTSQLATLLQTIGDLPELDDLRCVLDGLYNGNIAQLVDRPGTAATAFAELWQEARFGPLAPEEIPEQPTATQADSLIQFALYGLLDIDEPSIRAHAADGLSDRLLQVASGRGPAVRGQPDHSYHDEVESLLLGKSREDLRQLFWHRYSDEEPPPLAALRLGLGGYFSE